MLSFQHRFCKSSLYACLLGAAFFLNILFFSVCITYLFLTFIKLILDRNDLFPTLILKHYEFTKYKVKFCLCWQI